MPQHRLAPGPDDPRTGRLPPAPAAAAPTTEAQPTQRLDDPLVALLAVEQATTAAAAAKQQAVAAKQQAAAARARVRRATSVRRWLARALGPTLWDALGTRDLAVVEWTTPAADNPSVQITYTALTFEFGASRWWIYPCTEVIRWLDFITMQVWHIAQAPADTAAQPVNGHGPGAGAPATVAYRRLGPTLRQALNAALPADPSGLDAESP